MRRFFSARGEVQGVMFRQTLIRGAQKRNLHAGASNLPGGREVLFTLEGDEALLDEMVQAVRSMDPLNSWGARVDELVEKPEGQPVAEHQVHTGNVDDFSWNPNVEMYL